MSREVVTCRPESDLERAAHLMWTHDCGVLPVLGEGDRVVGLVTDRDLLMGAYTRGRALRELRVGDCMSHEVHSCLPSDTLEAAIRALGSRRVRRLPVVDEQGLLQGLLSVNDVVRHVEASPESISRARLEEALLEALAAICEPRTAPAVAPAAAQPQAAAPAPAPSSPRGTRSARPADALTVA